jgi:hypothetical protein
MDEGVVPMEGDGEFAPSEKGIVSMKPRDYVVYAVFLNRVD